MSSVGSLELLAAVMERTTLLVLLCIHIAVGAKDDDIFYEDNNCLPQLADTCFSQLHKDLECFLNPKVSVKCKPEQKKSANDLCSSAEGALNCAGDIIDTDCTIMEGRDRFDSWMKGLKAIYSKLCSDSKESLKVLVTPGLCYSSSAFVECMEESKVQHVVDLLNIKLDLNKCLEIAISMATCNAKATTTAKSCERHTDVIREVLLTFFTQTQCGVSFSKSEENNGAVSSFLADHKMFQSVIALFITHVAVHYYV